jgi:hypothetical protein
MELFAGQIRRRRPVSSQANITGGFPVSFRSSWTPPLPLPAPQRPPWPAVAGVWEPVGLGHCPSRPGEPGQPTWPQAPWSVALGQVDPGCKKFLRIYLFQKNCCKYLKFVKCIENYPFIGKIQMTYQNAQKNVTYLFVSKSCIVKQL